MPLTTDPNDPCLKNGRKEEGQNNCYLILSEEERSKGFVRPYRNAYIHVGKKLHYHSIDRVFDKLEKNELNGKYYVAILNVMGGDGEIIGGSYVTQDEFDAWKNNKLIGGCGSVTTMGRELSETYARDNTFYSATFCVHCNKHLPVEEFIWSGTDEKVGS